MQITERVYESDSLARECAAVVTAVEGGAVVLDRTVAYPSGGGQEGDTGWLIGADGTRWRFAPAVNLPGRMRVAHPLVAEAGEGAGLSGEDGLPEADFPPVGTAVRVEIDWEVRQRRMRLHTALHVLCGVINAPVTGCAIGDDTARIDFDLPEATLTKEDLTAAIMAEVAADRAISAEYISLAEFHATPELVRTTAVAPPEMPHGVRVVTIAGLDRQACGGTHVSSTGEVGAVAVEKIKKKSRLNRRISIALV